MHKTFPVSVSKSSMAKQQAIRLLRSLLLLLVLLLRSTSNVECSVHDRGNHCVGLAGLGVLIGCLDFIRKDRPPATPSPECCQGVRTIGMGCTCKLVTQEIEKTISMKKLLHVAGACGQPLASGTMCGSYRVPQA